jgi:hypothetical protein
MNSALVGIVTAALLALGLGFLAQRGRQMGLGQWTVAGRSFGAPLVFLLMAGEIYTTFTFLGGSGHTRRLRLRRGDRFGLERMTVLTTCSRTTAAARRCERGSGYATGSPIMRDCPSWSADRSLTEPDACFSDRVTC